MKPMVHAVNSAKKFGGKASDYIKIHNWFDQTKSHFPDYRHRSILHSSFGIFLCEQMFGEVIKNSDEKEVSVRDIGEQHVLEDFRGKGIPTIQDWCMAIQVQPWMDSGNGNIPSTGQGTSVFLQSPFPVPVLPKPKSKKRYPSSFRERVID